MLKTIVSGESIRYIVKTNFVSMQCISYKRNRDQQCMYVLYNKNSVKYNIIKIIIIITLFTNEVGYNYTVTLIDYVVCKRMCVNIYNAHTYQIYNAHILHILHTYTIYVYYIYIYIYYIHIV